MSITDELRTSGIYRPASNRRYFTEGELTAIADRIDAEHEAACAEAYGNGVMSVPIALDESAWVKLPVDADGVPIRPGDELVIFETGERICAYDIELYDDGRWLVCDDETMDSIHPDRLRHHHEPTVEDVLRDYASRILIAGCIDEEEELVVEYAAKLRLAGDAE